MGIASKSNASGTPANAVEVRLGNAVLGYYVGRGKGEAAAGADARGVKNWNRRFTLAALRLTEVEAALTDMFGGAVDTDDAEFLLHPVAATVAWKLTVEAPLMGRVIRVPELTRRVCDYCRRWFPRLSLEQVASVALQMANDRRCLTAEEIGEALGMTWDRRVRLSLRTIGVAGMSPRQMQIAAKKLKRKNDKSRAEATRRAAGIMPRAVYEQQSDTALAKRLGVNRKTISRWRAAGILEQKIAEQECPKCVADKGNTDISRDGHGTSAADAVGGLMAPTRHFSIHGSELVGSR